MDELTTTPKPAATRVPVVVALMLALSLAGASVSAASGDWAGAAYYALFAALFVLSRTPWKQSSADARVATVVVGVALVAALAMKIAG